MELVPSAAHSMAPLELEKSVIAVPLLRRYSCVEIRVGLHVVRPRNYERDLYLDGSFNFFLDKHTGEIRVEHYEDFFVPVADSDDASRGGFQSATWRLLGASGSTSRQGTGQTSEQQVKVQVNITSPGFHVSPLKRESWMHML